MELKGRGNCFFFWQVQRDTKAKVLLFYSFVLFSKMQVSPLSIKRLDNVGGSKYIIQAKVFITLWTFPHFVT